MSVLELSRWQFGITTVYHFLFVPITIGLAFLVAGFETAWLRSGDDRWLRLTKFYGKLFLINFAMGVVTGIVQEFQFGMNWSAYSRFVGDIFGAPLAIEALLAFFMESTFLGLWIFGWDRLSSKLHAACMWLVAVGTMLSAYFILAANSWVQHPVGYHYNPATHREELTSFLAVMTSPTQLVTFPHTIAGTFLVAGALVTAVALWHLIRRPAGQDAGSVASATAFRSAAKASAITVLDEPAEHLDEDTAREPTRDLLDATERRTRLLITHRPVSSGQVDKIVRLDGPAGHKAATPQSLAPKPRVATAVS